MLSGITIVALAGLGLAAVFAQAPPTNHDLILVIVSGLTGALGGAGASKIADKLTQSSGPNATVQPDAPQS